jgi:hypothetical protein
VDRAADLSSLSDSDKLDLLVNDAPELLELLGSFKDSVTEIRGQIAPLIQQVRAGQLPTSSGSSFLEVKFHLLLSYCTNVVFYMLLKAKGESVRDHPVIETLVKLRAMLEKCRPIDKKLKYQIDKLLAAAANPEGDAVTGPLSHKPRPQLMDGDDDSEDDSDGNADAPKQLYTAPKIAAAHYDNDNETAKAARKASAKKGRALKSGLIKSMQEELSEAPMEIKGAPLSSPQPPTVIRFASAMGILRLRQGPRPKATTRAGCAPTRRRPRRRRTSGSGARRTPHRRQHDMIAPI